jgi:hypothetical protein
MTVGLTWRAAPHRDGGPLWLERRSLYGRAAPAVPLSTLTGESRGEGLGDWPREAPLAAIEIYSQVALRRRSRIVVMMMANPCPPARETYPIARA